MEAPAIRSLHEILTNQVLLRGSLDLLRNIDWDPLGPNFRHVLDEPLGTIITIDNQKASFPVVKGMHCEVELRGRARPNGIVIPRIALRQKHTVYLANGKKLTKRHIEIDFVQEDFVVVKNGLKEGDKVILSDIAPAAEGLSVTPSIDQKQMDYIFAKARGTKRFVFLLAIPQPPIC